MFVCVECGASAAAQGPCAACRGATDDGSQDGLLGATIGPYRIAKLLGVGGMGRVYKAVQPQIGSRVAVKVLSRECTDRKDLVERFFSEARAVNLIRHESIVNVLDLSMLPDGRPYIVMEYLDGAPLSDLVSRLGAMPLGGVAKLAVEVLDALGAAHAKGIVHRDLKPDNIFVTPAGRAKILDFGIAKLLPELGGSFTQTGSLLGTPHYMSPEQASGKPVDHRTDLYAMGVILFECATGHKPFYGDSMFDLLRKHVDLAPPPPRSLRPDLPMTYEAVILAALAKDPAQRFPSAGAMAAALQQATAGMPPEQWAQITGSAAGVVATTPSGAGFGTPASWGGASRAAAAGSAPAPLPQPPAYGAPAAPGMHGPTTPLGRPYAPGMAPPGHAPPPHLLAAQHPTTAAAGQLVRGGRRGGSKALWAVLGLGAVSGLVVTAVVMSNGGNGGSATGAAQGSAAAEQGSAQQGSGQTATAEGRGSANEATNEAANEATNEAANEATNEAANEATTDALDQPTNPPTVASTTGGAERLEDLPEFRKLLAQVPANQRDYVKQQLRIVDAQLRVVPAAQRVMVMKQLRLAMSSQYGVAEEDDADPAPQQPPASAPAEREEPAEDLDPEAPLPKGWNGQRFDVDAYLPTALATVRRVAPDAQLFRIDAQGVLPSGLVDLSHGSVRYGFFSKKRGERPKNVPLGAKWSPNCQINIWVEASGIDVREFVGCKEVAVPAPRCSFKQRWQLAISKGAPKDNAIAELGYRASVIGGKPVWFFQIGDAFDDGPSPDDCR